MKLEKDILDKIEKLLNLARAGSGATDAERNTAQKMADKIMMKYGLEVNRQKYEAGEIDLIAVPEAKKEQIEALARALKNVSFLNYSTILKGFASRGIDPTDIIPRGNVFTYGAWQALGRQVQKGEKGVKIQTMIVGEKKDKATGAKTGEKTKFFGSTTVFHISQTKGKKPEYTGLLQTA
tara:strand:- start:132 stop:671 length:540 start_codon:yes stop_codon:yes gene_type:complete